MTEAEVRAWLAETLNVSRETLDKLDHYRSMVIAESDKQNLIAASTITDFWSRHILDSAQLLLSTPVESADGPGSWLDLGSGAGLPGIVVALLHRGPVHLVESRKGRIAFLKSVAAELDLTNVTVHGRRVEAVELPPVDVITGRAFAPLVKLFTLAHRFSTPKTHWILPKGQSAQAEVESLSGTWQGEFHVKQSLTNADAAIIVAHNVRRVGTR